MTMTKNKKITGLMFYYYFICHRKLWLFSRGLNFEEENEYVQLGKLIDENSYKREQKGIRIDETINIDFIRDWKILHEVKKSKSIEEANIWQLKYYLWFLKKRDIKAEKGVLDYPKLKIREEVELNSSDETQIEKIIVEIEKLLEQEKTPDKIDSKICKKCAYYEYCFV